MTAQSSWPRLPRHSTLHLRVTPFYASRFAKRQPLQCNCPRRATLRREDLDGWARENTHVATAKSNGRPFAGHLRQPNRELSNHNQSALLPTRGAPFWPMTSQTSHLAISLSLHAIYLVCKVHPTPAPPWRTLPRPTSHVESSWTTIVHQSRTLHFMNCLGGIVLRCRPQR